MIRAIRVVDTGIHYYGWSYKSVLIILGNMDLILMNKQILSLLDIFVCHASTCIQNG